MHGYENADASLTILHAGALSDAARDALKASSSALDHGDDPLFFDVEELTPQDLALAVHTCDPWSVVAVDEQSIAALREAFSVALEDFAPDAPAIVRGYTFVAVPAFEACLQDQEAKRVAWRRLKDARHPGKPC